MNEKLIKLLRSSPRVSVENVTDFAKKKPSVKRGNHSPFVATRKKFYNIIRPGPGFEEHVKLPWFLSIPRYENKKTEKNKPIPDNYVPLTLWNLQRLVDLGRIDTTKPIDLITLVKARSLDCENIDDLGHGVVLTEQGSNIFKAKLNIEVQIANEITIAAIEKNGGTITTAFYDKPGIEKLYNPVAFFLQGEPIPKRILPPRQLIKYYTDPSVRGYLSDPKEINKCREELAKKFGYVLPDIMNDENYQNLAMRKDPRQLYFGLAPGWIVNLYDRNILKPNDENVKEYFEL